MGQEKILVGGEKILLRTEKILLRTDEQSVAIRKNSDANGRAVCCDQK